MRRYGIPASVILAQGILESSNGQSRLALAENNHFGIKATPEWIAQGGRYGLYTDDKPNEKFCSYESVGESYEHHSRFLKENGRYARCFALAPDDYKGWTQGLEQAGYATGGRYADSLQRIIEQNGLQRYDRQVMREMEAQGKRFGVEESPLREAETAAEYAFPVEREEFLFVASPFGMRPDRKRDEAADAQGDRHPLQGRRGAGHGVRRQGRRRRRKLRHGGVRPRGRQPGTVYLHAPRRYGREGRRYGAGRAKARHGGQRRGTPAFRRPAAQRGRHAAGRGPAAYLAEIARKGNLKQQALHDGNDLLARYKGTEESAAGKNLSPDEWMKKLLSSEDSGVGLSGCNDPVVEMAVTAFASLMLLAVQIDGRSEQEQKAAVSAAADRRRIDLKPLLPGMRSCELAIGENGRATLLADNGNVRVSRELTPAEMSRLSPR